MAVPGGGGGGRSGAAHLCLTVGDAPGDSPGEFAAVLDALRDFGARAIVFRTTGKITEATGTLLDRACAEGHELANHCPRGRPYHGDSEAAFEAALLETQAAIGPYASAQRAAGEAHCLSTTAKRFKWLRAPSGRMGTAMRRVLARHG